MARLSFPTLFNLLLNNIMSEDKDRYTLPEISEQVGVSITQLGKYRSGERDNPTIESAISILDFFGMPSSYLDSASEDEALELIQKVQSEKEKPPPLPAVRFRNSDGLELSEKGVMQVQKIVSWALAREKALEKGDPEPPLPDLNAD